MIKKEGPGWRIIRDSSRDNFSTLIGGDTWAIELNKSEWENLVKVVIDLSDQYKSVKEQLMGDEPEPLEVVKWPLQEWQSLLAQEDFTEARSVAALMLAKQYLS